MVHVIVVLGMHQTQSIVKVQHVTLKQEEEVVMDLV
jgi:hypothetical protein